MTEAAGPWWRIDDEGRAEGPFGETEMRAALHAGTLRVSDPVWSPDVADWGPYERLFPSDPARDPRAPLGLLALSALAFGAASAAVIALIVGNGPWDGPGLPSLPILRAIWIVLALVMAASTFAVARLGRRSVGMLRGRPRGRRFLRGTVTVLAGLGLALSVLQGVMAAVMPDYLADAGTYRFTVTREADPARIVIDGEVGLGFGRAVIAALDAMPDPLRVEIESGGGLVAEAMDVARAIAARPGATVVARRECVSACTIVLMAGSRRLADRGMTIDFHALSIVEPESARKTIFGFDPAVAIGRYWGDDYLESRGVPPDIIAEANRRGHEDVYAVTAATLLKRGVLTGLVEPQPMLDEDRSDAD